MVALTGNTGPYLQYAAARIRSIFRSAGMAAARRRREVTIIEPGERALALKLLDFGDVVAQVGDELEPHRLCAYLFELAQAFSVFYEQCPVLKAEPAIRESRLALCALTMHVLVTGLDLLGIEAHRRRCDSRRRRDRVLAPSDTGGPRPMRRTATRNLT